MVSDGEAQVACFELDRGAWPHADALLDDAELARASRFKHERDRRRFVRSHAALRSTLALALGIDPRALVFTEGAHGRPELTDGALRFSLSHSGGIALVALARRAVGVDAEAIRAGPHLEVARFFSAREQAALAAVPNDERCAAFFRAWVRKEAYLKARGTGLQAPLHAFDVSLEPGSPAQLLGTRPDSREADRWTLADVAVPNGYIAALAHEGPLRNVVVRVCR
ncbi:MAG: 4'-phosphopantetheinyl transferase superfamily protein [Deltaproteobacteria bacterium]|nr:4'-phosphopantetheinyl transferase superfamily protein [Deltaproteobacteria bacterium]